MVKLNVVSDSHAHVHAHTHTHTHTPSTIKLVTLSSLRGKTYQCEKVSETRQTHQ